MAVAPADLIQPVGEIDPSLFPADDGTALADRVQAYVTDGEARASALPTAEQDSAVRAWAYYRAFSAAYVRLNAEAASVTFAADDGSISRLSSQIANIGALADRYMEEWSDAVIAAAPTVARTDGTIFRTVGIAW